MIRQRGQTWEVRVYVGTDPTTHKKRHLHRTARTADAATKLERRLKVEVDDDKHAPGGSGVTVSQLIDESLDLADLSPRTLAEYRGYAARHLTDLADLPIRRLTPLRLTRHYDNLKRRGLSPATIRQLHTVIARACTDAVAWGWIASNPAAGAKRPREERVELELPGRADIVRLLDIVNRDDPDYATLLWIALVTGARRGELCALRWSDVEGDRLHIRRAVVALEGKLIEKDTKTRNRRVVGLDPATIALLETHHTRCVERASACGAVLSADAYLFSSSPAALTPKHPNTVTARYCRLAKKHDVPGRFHDLRHWHVTLLLSAGVPVHEVSARVGHASVKMTLDTYAHALAGADQASAAIATKALTQGDAIT